MGIETATLKEIQEDIHLLRAALDGLQAKVNELASKQETALKQGRPLKFTDLKGILKGVDISYEEIKAAEYKVPEDLL